MHVLLRSIVVGAIAAVAAFAGNGSALAAPTCPLSYGTTDAAKSNKLYLYFPTAADSTFPSYVTGSSPAQPFNVGDLTTGIGTTTQLEDRIHDVVADDYCEFNVQVLQTTTNPATLPTPPARRSTIAIGSDHSGPTGAWGQAQEVDTGDAIGVDFARVWAGEYTQCEGAAPDPANPAQTVCTTGSLTGTNNTLDRWAQAIGGTSAHEAGHTYGLAHTDDDPPTDPFDGQAGPTPLAGEDAFSRHLMPAGYFLSGENRASFRRHFSDRTFGLLATNVGLSVQTMHNWDLVNPNAASARSLRMDFLSQLTSVNVSWSYTGSSSPWISPSVTSLGGTTTFHGTTYHRYRITWSTPNPAWTGTAGVVGGGGHFHIGATFTGVDFNQPDPIVIQNITLLDAGSNPLTLHPRLPIYDAGSVDSATGTFDAGFFGPFTGGGQLLLQNIVIRQLPRVASIESLTGAGRPRTFDGLPIRPWSTQKCATKTLTSSKRMVRCAISKLSAPPHVSVVHLLPEKGVVDCSHGVPKGRAPAGDRAHALDDEGPICAGRVRDPFPSTTIYVTATVVDPKAKHFDPKARRYVVGPVVSKLYYQFAGIRHLRRKR